MIETEVSTPVDQTDSKRFILNYLLATYRVTSATECRRPGGRKSLQEHDVLKELQSSGNTELKAHVEAISVKILKALINKWLTAKFEEKSKVGPGSFIALAPTVSKQAKVFYDTFKVVNSYESTVAMMYARDPDTEAIYRYVGEPEKEKILILCQGHPKYKEMMEDYYKNITSYYDPEYLAYLEEEGEDVPDFTKWLTGQYEAWRWAPDTLLEDSPVQITKDPKQPAFFLLDTEKIRQASASCPTWDEWMLKMPEEFRDVFKAWIFSILDPQNFGRQALWLKSKGYDGKGAVSGALQHHLKGLVGAVSQGSVEKDFFFSSVWGKRLVIFDDNKDSKFLMKGAVHSLVGNGFVQMERKFEHAISLRMHARIMIFANIHPTVNITKRHETSRIIYIPLESTKEMEKAYIREDGALLGDNSFEQRLKDEFWSFIKSCVEPYKRLCPNRVDIALTKDLQDKMFETITTEEHDTFEDLFTNNFVIDKDNEEYFTPVKDMHQEIKTLVKDSSIFTVENARLYLENVYGIKLERPLIKGERKRGYQGIILKKKVKKEII